MRNLTKFLSTLVVALFTASTVFAAPISVVKVDNQKARNTSQLVEAVTGKTVDFEAVVDASATAAVREKKIGELAVQAFGIDPDSPQAELAAAYIVEAFNLLHDLGDQSKIDAAGTTIKTDLLKLGSAVTGVTAATQVRNLTNNYFKPNQGSLDASHISVTGPIIKQSIQEGTAFSFSWDADGNVTSLPETSLLGVSNRSFSGALTATAEQQLMDYDLKSLASETAVTRAVFVEGLGFRAKIVRDNGERVLVLSTDFPKLEAGVPLYGVESLSEEETLFAATVASYITTLSSADLQPLESGETFLDVLKSGDASKIRAFFAAFAPGIQPHEMLEQSILPTAPFATQADYTAWHNDNMPEAEGVEALAVNIAHNYNVPQFIKANIALLAELGVNLEDASVILPTALLDTMTQEQFNYLKFYLEDTAQAGEVIVQSADVELSSAVQGATKTFKVVLAYEAAVSAAEAAIANVDGSIVAQIVSTDAAIIAMDVQTAINVLEGSATQQVPLTLADIQGSAVQQKLLDVSKGMEYAWAA